jgi:hypothetical protein
MGLRKSAISSKQKHLCTRVLAFIAPSWISMRAKFRSRIFISREPGRAMTSGKPAAELVNLFAVSSSNCAIGNTCDLSLL